MRSRLRAFQFQKDPFLLLRAFLVRHTLDRLFQATPGGHVASFAVSDLTEYVENGVWTDHGQSRSVTTAVPLCYVLQTFYKAFRFHLLLQFR